MKRWIYRNIRKKCWSISNGKKVIDHKSFICLTNVEFKVRESGRLRVLEEQRKNVHAFVIGELKEQYPSVYDLKEIKYNPYKNKTFVLAKTGERIYKANYVFLDSDGKVWAQIE